GVFENNERRFAAQLQRQLFVAHSSRAANRASHFSRSGECNLVDAWILHKRFACPSVSCDNVHDARWQFSLTAKLSERERGERGKFGRLQHHGVTCSKRGRNLPRQHEQWKIPRNDLPDYAARLMLRKLLLQQLRPSGVIVKMPRDQGDIDV